MRYPNLSQATYDRLTQREANNESQTKLDIADLLEAYESAVLLLGKVMEKGACPFPVEVEIGEFLYTENGDPRVDLREDE